MGFKLACVLRENIPAEVANFRGNVWQEEPILLDHQWQFYAAVAGGKPNSYDLAEYIKNMQNPTPESKRRQEEGQRRATYGGAKFMKPPYHNMVGQGLMMGGLYVLRRGGGVEWAHHEEFPGDTITDTADFVAAARRAAAAAKL